jgi:hypothetical protein
MTKEIEMIAELMLKPLRAVVALALLLGSVNGLAADAVVESFDRLLAHQPGPTKPVITADRDADPLIHAMVIPLRDPVRDSPAALAYPIAESFARMLAHTPGTVAPPLPPHTGPDPLIVAIVEPLRQSLSESAAATHFDIARSAATEQ